MPVAQFSSHLLSAMQSNRTQHLPEFSGREVCFTTDVDSESSYQPSQRSFEDMQKESRKLNRDTTWLRVVHRGYGQLAWRNELQDMNLTFVHGSFASEGEYVLIPDGLCAQSIVEILAETNMKVRKIVWFRGMKRANKSRVLFKWAPFSVSPSGDEKPTLSETNAFCGNDH
jgi:hypothetical protein